MLTDVFGKEILATTQTLNVNHALSTLPDTKDIFHILRLFLLDVNEIKWKA